MKRILLIALLAALYFSVNPVAAQRLTPDKIVAPKQVLVEKPKIFHRLPEKLSVKKVLLDDLFLTRQSAVNITMGNGIVFEGTILEKVQKNPNVVSINIRVNNYDSSLLNISRITQSDLSVSYIARVINITKGDVLLLKKENDQFYFVKEKRSLIAVE